MAATVLDCVNAVRSGNFEEVIPAKDERIIVLNSQLIANYTLVLAHCLLNNIPDDGTGEVFKLRAAMFDEVVAVINTYNYGRANKLVEELEAVCAKYEDKTAMWPSKKERNNIMLFIPQYIIWDEITRVRFFGGDVDPKPEQPAVPPQDNDVDIEEVWVE